MRCPAIGLLVLSCLTTSRALAATGAPEASARFAPFGSGNGQLSVAADPGSGALFAGFEIGGVFRSTDGGRSWTRSGQGLGDRRIMAVAASASGELYAVADARVKAEVFGSVDHGSTWSLQGEVPLADRSALRHGSLVPGGEPGALYLALRRDLWKSEDRGRHWSRILQVKHGITAVVGLPGSRGVYAGTAAPETKVLYSADGGTTWKELQNSLPFGSVNGLAVSPGTTGQPARIYIGIGRAGLFESTDEGATWRQPDPPYGSLVLYDVAVDAAYPSTVYAAYRAQYSEPFQVRVSRDGGATWTSGGLLMADSPPLHGVDLFIAGSTLYAANVVDLVASIDQGASWSYRLRGGFGYDGDLCQIRQVPGDPSTLYTLQGLRAFKSADGGRTWTSFATALLQDGKAALRDLTVDPARPATLYAAGELGVFKSSDGGDHWSHSGPPADVLAVLPGGAIVAGGCGLMRTSDGGATWEEAFPCTPVNGYPRKVEKLLPDPVTENAVYALVAETTSEGKSYARTIYRSRDAGRTWSPILPGAAALAVSPRAPAILYAVQDGVLFMSRDGGDTFQAAGLVGPGRVALTGRITDLLVDGKAPATVYAATQGSGMWRSTDGGATWVRLQAESLAYSENQACEFAFGLTADLSQPDVLYAADRGRLTRIDLRR